MRSSKTAAAIIFSLSLFAALPTAAARAKPVDRLTLKGGEVVEGRVEDRTEAGYTIIVGGRKRYVDMQTVVKAEWDVYRQKWPWYAQAGGGPTTALGPASFADYSQGGIGASGVLGYQLKPWLGLQVDFNYDGFSLNQDKATEGLASVTSVEGGNSFLGAGLLSLRLFPMGRELRVAPYLSLGTGLYSVETRFLEIVDGNTIVAQVAGSATSGTALGLAGGVEVSFTRHVGLYLEARWINALDAANGEAVTLMPIRAGLCLRYGNTDPGTTADF